MSTQETSTTRRTKPRWRNLAQLLHKLGDIAPERVWAWPPPGQATEEDAVEIEQRTGRLCELVDGVLVEKIMGRAESTLAIELAWHVRTFLEQRQLGFLAGADGAARILPGLIRYPDLSFFLWDNPEKHEQPTDAIAPTSRSPVVRSPQSSFSVDPSTKCSPSDCPTVTPS